MSVELNEVAQGKYLEVHVSGKLDRETYQTLVPQTESQIERYGKIRVLFAMHDFHGWDTGGLWEDIKFDAKHFNDFERIAIVGDRKWERGMAVICKPFTTATVRFFDESHLEDARAWLSE
ncbi:SpoIIAA family protein [Rhodopirellula sallentina]|uniref:UspA domain protein n=1 Tax=Rhodopirellula sallentina SM41 TaxID=1263870 RepID=M5U6T7_9BACT|nr:STAS/SEC14 domain-containing protein [Rhodopirellula sallentina]EMI57145.1 UspA domain protein [Rhodopirellula sallentina SM41]